MNSLGIAIDGGRYVRIDSRIGELPRNVRLRALDASQRSAVLDFCRFRRGKADIIRSHRVRGLKSRAGEPAELRLRIERRGWAIWEVRVSGAGSKAEVLRLRTGVGLWPILIPAAGLFGLLIWLLINFTILNPGSAVPPKTETGISGVEQTAAAQPSDPATTASNPVVAEAAAVETATPDAADDPADTRQSSAEGTAANDSDAPEDAVAEVDPTTDEPAVDTATPQNSAAAPLPAPITVYFQPESAELSTRAIRDLDDLAAQMRDGMVLDVDGHSADYGTERGQLALSRLRARNVADYLRAAYPGTLNVTVNGYGFNQPATRDPGRQELNRRVTVTLSEVDE